MFFEKIFSATRAKGTFTLLSPVLFYSTFDRITSGEVPIEGILIVAIKLSISVFFLDYSLSFFISSAGLSTNFCSAWLAVGAMRLLPP